MMWSLCLYPESFCLVFDMHFNFSILTDICAGMGWDISAVGQIVTKWLKETLDCRLIFGPQQYNIKCDRQQYMI